MKERIFYYDRAENQRVKAQIFKLFKLANFQGNAPSFHHTVI